jgi:hypothetical protein
MTTRVMNITFPVSKEPGRVVVKPKITKATGIKF